MTDDEMRNGFIGEYGVEFTNGLKRILNIEKTIHNTLGQPIYLCTLDGETYPFFNVLHLRKLPSND